MASSEIPSLQLAFTQLRKELNALYGSSEAALIAEMTISKVSGMSRSERICYPDKKLSKQQWQQWEQWELELLTGRPVQYVLGTTEFYGLSLYVDESVLIPRPETEELVALTVQKMRAICPFGEGLNVLDIGTGSGCIALALKKELPLTNIFAADNSESALATAKQNAQQNQLAVSFFRWDVLQEQIPAALPKLDAIISNPPYITVEEQATMQPHVLEFEPHSALFVSNRDPLQFYKKINQIGQQLLKEQGKIFLELNEHYGFETLQYFQDEGWEALLQQDFQGKNRMLVASDFSNAVL